MAKEVPFFLPSSQADARKIQRQMMMAQMLMSQQRPQREQTRIVPREDLATSLLPALSQAAGMFMQNKAMQGEEDLKAKEYAALLEAMGGGTSGPMSPTEKMGQMQSQGQMTPGIAPPSDPGVDGGGASAMNPFGLDPQLAAHAYQADPAKYMGEVLSANKPTDLERKIQAAGFTPEQVRQAYEHALLPAPKDAKSQLGVIQPGDYTPASIAKYQQTGNIADLERYVTPRQEYSPSYQNVTRTLPDGSTEQGTFDTRSGIYNWGGMVIPPGQKKRVEAQAAAEGEAAGSQSTKAPVAASMEYVLQQFDTQLPKTMQGGVGGVTGKAGAVFDYKDKQRFDNLREQLSTELRTVYRIPGEGTLSDREQAQYGIQLPSTDNHPDVNRAILQDLRERTRLRLQTPIAPKEQQQAPAAAIEHLRKNPQLKEQFKAKYGYVPDGL